MTPQVQIVCFRSCGPHYFIAVKGFFHLVKKKKKRKLDAIIMKDTAGTAMEPLEGNG